jgi:hypothetical protein
MRLFLGKSNVDMEDVPAGVMPLHEVEHLQVQE